MALTEMISRNDTTELRILRDEYLEDKEQEERDKGSWDRAMTFYDEWKAKQDYEEREKRKKVLFDWITTRTIVPLLKGKQTSEVETDEGSIRRICALHLQGMNSNDSGYNCPLIRLQGYCEETNLKMEKDGYENYFISTLEERRAREKRLGRTIHFERPREESVMLEDGENLYTYKIGEKVLV
jgi:hypothetical protein